MPQNSVRFNTSPVIMKHVHIVIPDLFLPQSLAKDVCADLYLPELEKILARGKVQSLPTHALETWLCQKFAVPELAIAPVTLQADGVAPGDAYWMRADPVHLRLDHAQMIVQTNVSLGMEEARQLCDSLNQYFAGLGMQFFAPHPQRWYVRLDNDPQLKTHSIFQVEGRDSRFYLPQGEAALKWHGVMNEIQMSLYGHPLSQACEARGGLPVNSVWLWGGGRAVTLARPFAQIVSDSDLVTAFAQTSNITHRVISDEQIKIIDNALYVWEGASVALRRGDFHAWRQSVLSCEQQCVRPLMRSLAAGELDKITLDILQEDSSKRFELTRAMLWKLWKRTQPLASYSLV
jgi:hypothetical protein